MKIYKNITKSIVFALSIGLLVSACDKIDLNDVNQTATVSSNKKVLIEDFTGHTCVNCPRAHEELHTLMEAYGDTNLFAVAIHAGSFANPTGTPFEYDFLTEAGNAYYNEWQPQAFPIGMVNRKKVDNVFLQDVGAWGTLAAKAFKETAPLNIKVEVDGISNQNTISGKVHLSFIEELKENVKLQIIVTEDSIIKPQLTPEGPKEDYVHMHVLRGAVNGNWGEDLPNDSYAANETATISFNNYTLGDDWTPKNLMVLAYLYNADTKEILQVNGAKVMP